mmetsp:Transcript_16221/g.63256  ORF Transcript_16221/g.63256 Transcript_16221/m.63256 type:complete len:257 (-) Transcript_16221:56-826(-)
MTCAVRFAMLSDLLSMVRSRFCQLSHCPDACEANKFLDALVGRGNAHEVGNPAERSRRGSLHLFVVEEESVVTTLASLPPAEAVLPPAAVVDVALHEQLKEVIERPVVAIQANGVGVVEEGQRHVEAVAHNVDEARLAVRQHVVGRPPVRLEEAQFARLRLGQSFKWDIEEHTNLQPRHVQSIVRVGLVACQEVCHVLAPRRAALGVRSNPNVAVCMSESLQSSDAFIRDEAGHEPAATEANALLSRVHTVLIRLF